MDGVRGGGGMDAVGRGGGVRMQLGFGQPPSCGSGVLGLSKKSLVPAVPTELSASPRVPWSPRGPSASPPAASRPHPAYLKEGRRLS